jgi:hypothetical protein
VLARHRHLLWLVEHHPESDLVINVGARVSKTIDPDGHAELERLWRAHTRTADASIPVLDNAAVFFQQSGDLETTEQLLLRIQAIPQPAALTHTIRDRSITPIWLRLGGLYAAALDADGSSPEATRRAARVRATLASSKDASLLAAVAQALQTGLIPAVPGRAPATTDSGRDAIAMPYLERALAIDPANPHANYVRASSARGTGFRVFRESGVAAATTRRTEADGSSLLAALPTLHIPIVDTATRARWLKRRCRWRRPSRATARPVMRHSRRTSCSRSWNGATGIATQRSAVSGTRHKPRPRRLRSTAALTLFRSNASSSTRC